VAKPRKPIAYVIDDDAAVRASLKVLLEEVAGIEVLSFASAGEFLRDAAPNENGCLVIDVDMPDVDGMSLLDRLRRNGIMTPAILVTGAGISQSLCSAAVRHSAALFEKPLLPGELISAVKRVLGA